MMNWKKCKLGDVATTTTTKIGCSDITSNYISTENMLPNKGGVVAASSFPSTGNVSTYQQGDILVSNIRPYFKKIWWATCNGTASNDVIVFHANEGVNSRYLYYTLADDNFFAYVMTGAKGTKMPRGDKKQMMLYPVFCPPLEEQKRIAEILGSLDDKIELLQKQNKTLEDMAKALFKSWFVDFDVVRAKQKGLPKADIMREYHLTDDLYDLFPSSFADSPLGPIPSGWEVKPLKDLASITAGKRPKQVKDIKDDNFFIPVYGGNGIKWWTNVSLYSTPIIITGRVGTLGKVYRIHEPVWVSDNALIFEVKKELFEYLLYMLQTIDFNSFNRGSTQPLITQSDIKEILAVFDQNIVQTFHSIVVEYEKKINNNNRQIQTLTELRDSLLPRLISGKIRVLIH